MADRLSREPKISVVYSSDLKRAFETAETIASSCGVLEVWCPLLPNYIAESGSSVLLNLRSNKEFASLFWPSMNLIVAYMQKIDYSIM